MAGERGKQMIVRAVPAVAATAVALACSGPAMAEPAAAPTPATTMAGPALAAAGPAPTTALTGQASASGEFAASAVTGDGVLGEVVRTGAGDWLIFAVPVVVDGNPGTRFGVALGLPGPVAVVLANESTGSDRSPGFHAVQGAARIGSRKTLTFGYYAGPAAKIQAYDLRRHRVVQAARATWSEDPSVVFFWFPSGTGPLRTLLAFDRDGHRLPPGDPGIAVG